MNLIVYCYYNEKIKTTENDLKKIRDKKEKLFVQ